MQILTACLRFLPAATLALATAVLAPVTARAETVLRAVMHSDLKILDPVWTAANITRNHGYMIYDTLFAFDADDKIQPQMVERYALSDDKKTYTFTLREGLLWHDNQPVTSEDCVASIKRWAVKDAAGQLMMRYVEELAPVDARTFKLVVKQPISIVLSSLAKRSGLPAFMMPKRVAETDPFKQIEDYTGSGPFILKKDEWKPGEKTVYVKNPKYKPRSEPMSGLAGGKVVGVDRVEWVWIPDTETQVNALQRGEIDMIESVNYDSLPILEKDKNVRIIAGRTPFQYVFRMNWLIPPFNNVKIRQAAMVALSQEEFLQANIGDKRFFRTCKALFTCGTPLASEVAMEDVLNGNAQKAREMLKEAGYDGTVVVLLQPTDLNVLKQLPIVAKAQLERAGFKVEIQSSDWTTMVNRLVTKKGPPSEGGWVAFATAWTQVDILDPLMTPYLAATCDKARAGWPCDETMEKLRDAYALAATPEERKKAAEEVQRHFAAIVTHVPLGEWFGVSAVRNNIGTRPVPPPVTVFWGMTKK